MKNNYLLSLFFVLICSSLTLAQVTITGKVTDSGTGEGLIGATVQGEGPAGTFGSITDVEGNYTIKVPEGVSSLTYTYTGYTKQEVAIAGRTTIDVILVEGVGLQELVLIGYGVEKKANVTGAIAEVEAPGSVLVVAVTGVLLSSPRPRFSESPRK